MPSEVILPRVDMDMATGKIAKWFVAPGSSVSKGQPLFEIETDKAAMEIEAPASGTIRDLAEASGRDIPVGSVVAWIDADGEAPVATLRPVGLPDIATPAAGPARSEAAEPARAPPEQGRPRATPLARRLAREKGLDLAAVVGSGPRGRIQAGDVAQALAGNTEEGDPDQRPATEAPATRDAAATVAAVATPASPLNLIRLREGIGAPVLLLHGFGADGNGWRPFLSGRTLHRPIYALDLPGHGLSPLGGVTSFAAVVDAVDATLAAAALGPLALVGHSLGGGVAAAVAARGTLDVRALLLLAPAGLGPEVNGAFVRGYLGATSEAALTPWLHELVVDPRAITPAFVRSTLKAREGTGLVATQRRVAEAVFPDATQAFSVRADLARLIAPTRIVVGLADRIIPPRHRIGLPGLIATHLFADVGHMPQLEAPDAVATILTQVLAG